MSLQPYKYQQKMQDKLLSAFNSFAFQNTTHLFLSNLTRQELKQILKAVQTHPSYSHLTHIIRATLFVSTTHQVDRTFYFVHYCTSNNEEFRSQRSSLVAFQSTPQALSSILQNYQTLQQKCQQYFGEDFQSIQTGICNPDLPLPSSRRSTIAPRCQTIYQIMLACQKLDEEQRMNDEIEGEESNKREQSIQYFFELLDMQAQMAYIELQAITNPLEHFSELVLRFMVYRNSVLSLHSIIPFTRLEQTMQLWTSIMKKHYLKANNTFVHLADFKLQDGYTEYGYFTPEVITGQGYLNQYIESLVDLSINMDIVAFCSHSKQQFGELYANLEEIILNHLPNGQPVKDNLNKWCNLGIKSCTILKIIEMHIKCSQAQDMKYQYCCRQDDYIQNCAKIHGFLDQSIRIQCS